MLDGDEWKNGDKPKLTPELAHKYKEHNILLLVSVSNWNGLQEVRVTAVSPCGGYAKLALGSIGRRSIYSMMIPSGQEEGNWVDMRDVQVLSVLRRDVTTAPVELDGRKRKNKGYGRGLFDIPLE